MRLFGMNKGASMDKTRKALIELREMDELSARSSPILALSPLAKLLAAVSYIAVVMSFDKYALSALAVFVLYPILLFQLSGIPVRTCFYKLRIVLPLVLAVGLFNPLFDRAPVLTLGTVAVSGGVLSMLTLMLKGTLCLMVSFLLMATTPVDALCAALRKLHLPSMLVTLFLLTYRYIGVMTAQVQIMTEAYHLRAPGQKGIHHSAWGSFLGQLLLRSMDRAEELYSSMLLRGFSGEFPYARASVRAQDLWYPALCTAVFMLLRVYDVPSLIGSLFVR